MRILDGGGYKLRESWKRLRSKRFLYFYPFLFTPLVDLTSGFQYDGLLHSTARFKRSRLLLINSPPRKFSSSRSLPTALPVMWTASKTCLCSSPSLHIQPQPSLASLAQLASDLIIHNFALQRIGFLGLRDHVPAVSGLDGLPGSSNGEGGVSFSVEGESPFS